MAKAFSEITGINLTHDLIQEGDVIEKLQTQMQSDQNIYDAYINDSDLIGTHFRYSKVVPLTDWMAGEGKDVTLPTLDVDDFMGKSFTTGPDGKLYQLPDQQFANLYWFRYDWFTDPQIKEEFKKVKGYDLGVPVNWSAYEDIADFFTNDVKEIDGVRVYGHMDYGKKDPSLGWRFTDAWLSHGRRRRQGHPQRPAGRRVGHPHGGLPAGRLQRQPRRRHQRPGGGLCAAEVHRLAARPTRRPRRPGMTFSEAGPCPARARSPSRSSGTPRSPRRSTKRRPAGDERRRHAQVAHGALAARPLLARGHEARLPGRRLLDADEVDAGRPPQGGLALRPVLRRQDDLAEEDHRRPDADPRQRHPLTSR